jgi:hypothetical protein
MMSNIGELVELAEVNDSNDCERHSRAWTLTSRAVDHYGLETEEHIPLRKRNGIVWYRYSLLSWIGLSYQFILWACRISEVYFGRLVNSVKLGLILEAV